MTAQLLDYPTASQVRVRPSRQGAGVPVAPHRQAPRRNLGPQQRVWSVAQAAAPLPVSAGVEGRLYWTPRGLAVMIAAVALIAVAMLATIVVAFLGVSDAPLVAAPLAATGDVAPILIGAL